MNIYFVLYCLTQQRRVELHHCVCCVKQGYPVKQCQFRVARLKFISKYRFKLDRLTICILLQTIFLHFENILG